MSVNPYQAPEADLTPQAHGPGDVPALWNPDAVANWSLLFTPIFGSILVSKNWRAIGDEKRASRALIWAYLLLPAALIRAELVLLIVWYFASARPQSRYVKQRWGKDYPRQPWAKPMKIMLLIYLVFIVAVVALYQLVSDPVASKARHSAVVPAGSVTLDEVAVYTHLEQEIRRHTGPF